MKKIISFSLWGNNPRYIEPAIENARRISELMPDWECRWYISSDVSSCVKQTLFYLGGRVIEMGESTGTSGALWRFRVLLENDVDVALFADADADKTKREVMLIREWEQSDKSLLIIRDHPNHVSPILAGAWGIRQKAFPLAAQMIFDGKEADHQEYGHDEYLLATRVYPLLIRDSWIHSPFRLYPGENADSVSICPTGLFIGNISTKTAPPFTKRYSKPRLFPWPWIETACILEAAMRDNRAMIFSKKETDTVLMGILIGLIGMAIPHHDLGKYRPSCTEKQVFSEYLKYIQINNVSYSKCYSCAIQEILSGRNNLFYIAVALLRSGEYAFRRIGKKITNKLRNNSISATNYNY